MSKGLTRVCLKLVGKDPSDNDRLMIMLIGLMSTSKQDLRSLVGIMSRSKEEFQRAGAWWYKDLSVILSREGLEGRWRVTSADE